MGVVKGKDGEENEEGGYRGEVRHQVRASLRKQIKKIEITQHSKYVCGFCGKNAVKRTAVGIWHCQGCNKTVAGGAWIMHTSSGTQVRSTIQRLKLQEEI